MAHVPQLPNVYNMTLRDNILFGRPMDATFYHQVIRSCQLLNDFNGFPNADMTEVGEKVLQSRDLGLSVHALRLEKQL